MLLTISVIPLTIMLCGSLFSLALVMDWRLNSGKCQAKELADTAYADAGYDADRIHMQRRVNPLGLNCHDVESF